MHACMHKSRTTSSFSGAKGDHSNTNYWENLQGNIRQTLYLKKQRGKGLVKLPWQIGSDLIDFLRYELNMTLLDYSP